MYLIIIFIAIFTQNLVGFGSGLIAMPLLVPLLGIKIATPLMALVMICVQVSILFRYRTQWSIYNIRRLLLGTVIGIPIGFTLVSILPESIIFFVLGISVISFALYNLFYHPELIDRPALNPRWAYVVGLIGGMLGGAYNTGGPPFIMYGTREGWPPAEFKSNLQCVFLTSSVGVILAYLLNGGYSIDILKMFLSSLPIILIALIAGTSLDRFIKQEVFQKVVLVGLIVLGLSLIF
ncbi:sulfite exporter TauE/SafE family protein [Anaerolineales bacterium]